MASNVGHSETFSKGRTLLPEGDNSKLEFLTDWVCRRRTTPYDTVPDASLSICASSGCNFGVAASTFPVFRISSPP